MVTKKEAAVIEIYTGVCMLVGDDRKYIYEYAENLVGRPVFTHELPYIADEFADKIKDDFIEICKNLTDEDIQPVVHAHWKEISRVRHIGKCNLPISRCSCCNFEFCDIINTNELYNFCPYCGAKMDEKEATYIKDIFMTR